MLISKQKFKEKISDMWITDYNSDEMNIAKIAELSECVLELIPTKLFRFRNCNNYSLQAFKNNEIWGTRVDLFNDTMDCLPTYDLRVVTEIIKESFDFHNVKAQLGMVVDDNLPTVIKDILTEGELNKWKEIFANDLINVNQDQLSQILTFAQNKAFEFLNENLNENTNDFYRQVFNFRNNTHLACFSENIYSSVMWGHYAQSHKGFAIEYKLKDKITMCSRKCESYCDFFHLNYQFAPVIYEKERYDASVYLAQMMEMDLAHRLNIPMKKMLDRDRFRIPKTILRKSLEWEYEQEWRLFAYSEGEVEDYKCLIELEPTAVYLGTNISKWYKSRIINLCKRKKIPCYQMLNLYTAREFKLVFDESSSLSGY